MYIQKQIYNIFLIYYLPIIYNENHFVPTTANDNVFFLLKIGFPKLLQFTINIYKTTTGEKQKNFTYTNMYSVSKKT